MSRRTAWRIETDGVTRGLRVYFAGEQLDFWNEGKVSEFSQFGSGIVLYFKFLKFLYWTFTIVSILYSPIIAINSYGNGIIDVSGLSTLGLTTVGNLGNPSNISAMEIPGCKRYNFLLQDLFQDSGSCTVDKTTLGVFYSAVDIAAMIVVLAGIRWLREFEETEVVALDRHTVSPSDFTVYIPWVPASATEENISEFFNRHGKKVRALVGLWPGLSDLLALLADIRLCDESFLPIFLNLAMSSRTSTRTRPRCKCCSYSSFT